MCDCINNAAKNCHKRCGGSPPRLRQCEVEEIVAPDSQYVTKDAPTCKCESVFCVQSFPEGCYCANAAAQACYAKCGGQVPDLKVRIPRTSQEPRELKLPPDLPAAINIHPSNKNPPPLQPAP
jgi:hypothetical protein